MATPFSWAKLGVSALSGISNLLSGNKNIDKQIKAQKEENQKNREYNLMLAQQQNQWNQEQWERENEYNTPVNQIGRLKQAGLNPDLAYGSGVAQSLASSSPQMTSGAPSTPVDMSPLGQKLTLGQAIQQSLANELTQAQIDNIKANSRKTEAESGLSEIELKFKELSEQLDIDTKILTNNLSAQEQEFAIEQFNLVKKQIQVEGEKLKSMKLDNIRKDIENSFKRDELKAIVKKLQEDAKISEQEAKFALESFTYRMLGIQGEGLQAKSDTAFIKYLEENAGDGLMLTLKAIRYFMEAIGK